MEQNIDPNAWLVVVTAGGKYIVRPSKPPREAINHLNTGTALECLEVLEYISHLREVPQPGGTVGLMKVQMASMLDGTTEATTMRISLAGALVYALEDMSPGDQVTYTELIQRARDMALQARAHKLGIEPASLLPKGH